MNFLQRTWKRKVGEGLECQIVWRSTAMMNNDQSNLLALVHRCFRNHRELFTYAALVTWIFNVHELKLGRRQKMTTTAAIARRGGEKRAYDGISVRSGKDKFWSRNSMSPLTIRSSGPKRALVPFRVCEPCHSDSSRSLPSWPCFRLVLSDSHDCCCWALHTLVDCPINDAHWMGYIERMLNWLICSPDWFSEKIINVKCKMTLRCCNVHRRRAKNTFPARDSRASVCVWMRSGWKHEKRHRERTEDDGSLCYTNARVWVRASKFWRGSPVRPSV